MAALFAVMSRTMPAHRGKGEGQRVGRLEHRHLVLLHVLAVGERQALHDDQQAVEIGDEPAGLGAHQLGGVRVALLRHDRAAGGEGVREADEAEWALDQITISSAKRERWTPAMAAAARNSRAKSRSETASIELAVGRAKPSALAVIVAVDRKGGPGERRDAERAFVEPALGSRRAGRGRARASRHRPGDGGRR